MLVVAELVMKAIKSSSYVTGIILICFICTFPRLQPAALAGSDYYLVSHAGAGDPFWPAVFNGARIASAELGIRLTVLAPEIPGDTRRQLELLESAVAQDAAGIATTIPCENAFSELLRTAQKKGIPVLAFNAQPFKSSRRNNPYRAYIGMDDYRAGMFLGRRLYDSGAIKKHGVIVNHLKNISSLSARCRGISEALEKRGVIVDVLYVSEDSSKIKREVGEYIRSHPALEALVCLGPTSAHPVGELCKERKYAVHIASFDLSPLIVRYIRDGIIDFTVDQQPFMQGYAAVHLMVLTARYRMTPPDIDTGMTIIDRTNVQAVEALTRGCFR